MIARYRRLWRRIQVLYYAWGEGYHRIAVERPRCRVIHVSNGKVYAHLGRHCVCDINDILSELRSYE
jgi:hypothetical protein